MCQDFVLSVALTPHGDWVLSGSKDRGVQFWDPHTGVAQLMLQGHKNSGMFNPCLSFEIKLTIPSHLGCSQPNWRCIRDGQRRHARSYLEVSNSRDIFFPLPQAHATWSPVHVTASSQAFLALRKLGHAGDKHHHLNSSVVGGTWRRRYLPHALHPHARLSLR